MLFYYMIWLISCFKYDGFILNMVIISNMDTQPNIWYLPSESNHVVNKWKSQASFNYHVNYRAFSPNSRGAFYPKYHTFTYAFIIYNLLL